LKKEKKEKKEKEEKKKPYTLCASSSDTATIDLIKDYIFSITLQ
jgi:hypothetical protein